MHRLTGETHRAGGMLVSVVGFELLRQKGLLLPNVNIALQWLVIYPFTMWGSVASDLDHHWESCPQKDYPSRLVNMVLHITKPLKKSMDAIPNAHNNKNFLYQFASLFNASHRSWQTHSDLTLFSMLYLLYLTYSGALPTLGIIDSAILTLILTGICLGVIAHFILDALTPDGIWLIGLVLLEKLFKLINPRIRLPKKLHLVPHTSYFATGGSWEQKVCKVLKVATVLAIIWLLITFCSPLISEILPFEITFNN